MVVLETLGLIVILLVPNANVRVLELLPNRLFAVTEYPFKLNVPAVNVRLDDKVNAPPKVQVPLGALTVKPARVLPFVTKVPELTIDAVNPV
jgi:hypothetical protein